MEHKFSTMVTYSGWTFMPQNVLQRQAETNLFFNIVFWSYVLLPNNVFTQQKHFPSYTLQSLLKEHCYSKSSHFMHCHGEEKTDMVCRSMIQHAFFCGIRQSTLFCNVQMYSQRNRIQIYIKGHCPCKMLLQSYSSLQWTNQTMSRREKL